MKDRNIMEGFEKALKDSSSNLTDTIKEKNYIIEALNEELRYKNEQKEILRRINQWHLFYKKETTRN